MEKEEKSLIEEVESEDRGIRKNFSKYIRTEGIPSIKKHISRLRDLSYLAKKNSYHTLRNKAQDSMEYWFSLVGRENQRDILEKGLIKLVYS